jgi:hypothetical protein
MTMTTMMIRRMLVGALALVALAPGALIAQTSAGADAARRSERAEILSEQAWLLANQQQEFALAASYTREAAQLRDDSPAKVADLLNAGRFHFYSSSPLKAVSAFTAAGEVALELGDLATAQRAFRDGAWVAARAGDMATARALLVRTSA